MEIKDMKYSDIEKRSAEIEEELASEEITEEKVEELEAEVKELEDKKEELKKEEESKKEEIEEIEERAKVVQNFEREETKNMEVKEVRKSQEYIDAYAEYVKHGMDMNKVDGEARALLSENADPAGTIAVPTYVEDRIATDWANSPILSRITKTFIKGNYKRGYEVSATGAVVHSEGADAPAEESLVIAYIEFVAKTYKKWITVSDEVLDLRGQAFLDYLLDEHGHQLALALENAIVAEIEASNLSQKVSHDLDGDAVLAGLAVLSDEASNPVVIMSKANYAAIKGIRTTTGARIDDPFEGLEVLFNANASGVIVVDLSGVVGNFPNGMEFQYKIDDLSLAEKDLVKIVARVMADFHLVQPNGAAVVTAGE